MEDGDGENRRGRSLPIRGDEVVRRLEWAENVEARE